MRFFFFFILLETILAQSCNCSSNTTNSKIHLHDSVDLKISFFNESEFDKLLSFEIKIDSSIVLNGDTTKYLSRKIRVNSGQHKLQVNIKNMNVKTDTTITIEGSPTLWIKYFYRPAYNEAKDLYVKNRFKRMIQGKTFSEIEKKEMIKEVERIVEYDAAQHPQQYSYQPAKIEIYYNKNKIPIE